MPSTSDRAGPPLAGAGLAALLQAAVFWPGVAVYDSVGQYGQALSGAFEDWHPPVMARLWALLLPLGGVAAPMLLLQLGGYWAGLGLIAGALARAGRARSGWAVLSLGLLPVFSGWQGVVVKDSQMAAACLAGVGLVAWFRLQGQRVPRLAAAASLLLIGYATLVRANAAFATMPLLVLLAGRPRRGVPRAIAVAGGMLAVLTAAPVVNHWLLGAAPTGVAKTQPLYDLAGVAVRTDAARTRGFGPAETAALRARGCVKAFFWDPLGDPAHCGPVIARVRALDTGSLARLLAGAVVAHPLAYAAHRMAHLNSTERWLVPSHLIGARPPAEDEPNDLGLRSPGGAARTWQAAAGVLVETPLGWPSAYVVAAATLLLGLRRRGGPARDLATALLVSALVLEASFAVVSIASDLRYHLWPMVATALAFVLAGAEADRTILRRGAAILALAVIAALTARVVLPMPPQSYAGMLG